MPDKLLLSACHLMVSITSTVRPVFLVTLPAIQNIFNLITTENRTRRLPQEVTLVCNFCYWQLCQSIPILLVLLQFGRQNTFICCGCFKLKLIILKFIFLHTWRLTCWCVERCPTCYCCRGQTYLRVSSSGKHAPATTPACWQPSPENIEV